MALRTMLFGSLCLLACSQAGESTRLQSVDVAQTEIRDQGRVGFCWGYATLGLIESMLFRNGVEVDLSEEALTFYRMAQALEVSVRKAARAADLIRVTIDATGWTRYPDGYGERPENSGIGDGFQLIEKFGVVPESAWSFKFVSGDLKTKVFRTIQNRVFKYALSLEEEGRSLSTVTLDEIIDNTMVGEGAFPSRPPRSFSWKGVEVSATAFLKQKGTLDRRLENFVALSASRPEDYGVLVQATKRSLAAGVPVPIGFPMSIARIQGNAFTGKGIPHDLGRDAHIASFASDGGHMMLVTDFVNEGGREGAMSPKELVREVEAPAESLAYFKMKNSWGIGARLTGWGMQIGASSDGYYIVDREYLQGVSRVASLDSRFVPFVVVVDRAFVQ